MARVVGIDLGTSNTAVAAVSDGVAATLLDPQSRRLIPSVVSFPPGGSVLVGHAALERRLVDAPNTIYSIKRLIGRPWGSPEIEQACARLPFALREGPKASVVVSTRDETYSLPELSAFVLRHAKAVAESSLGGSVDRAVITVPASFNDLQRAATKTAGRLAGLEVLRILNEPTAAALTYGPQGKSKERIAVYDFGGGTFDITILDLASNVFEVLATAGDTALGGDDIDLLVAERMADDLLKKHRLDARAEPAVFGRLRLFAEQMKRELSLCNEHTIVVDDLVPGARGAYVEWQFRLTRPELEWASLALIERTFKVAQRALDAGGVRTKDLDRILLVGGSTRMPMVARKVEQFFGKPPLVRINPDEVVALGAAIQASLLDRSKKRAAGAMLQPRISEDSVVGPLPEDSNLLGGAVVPVPTPLAGSSQPPLAPSGPPQPAGPAAIAGADFLPGTLGKPLVFDLPPPEEAIHFEVAPAAGAPARGESAGPHPVPSFAPHADMDTVARPAPPRLPTIPYVAQGASLPAPQPPAEMGGPLELLPQGSVDPPRPAPLLIDVTPLSLSVETAGGFCDVLIEANTPVPCDRSRTFATASDGQTTVVVKVAQGEQRRFANNTHLGELELTGLAPAPRGATAIAVTFEIDADGILDVRARDVRTGRETAARMQLVGAQTSPEELEAMRLRQAVHPLASLEAPR